MTLRKRKPLLARQTGGLAAVRAPEMQAERLVGVGFRCWLAGYETHDIDCWETGWNHYARELGPARAKTAVTELTCWVRAVHRKACRRIYTYPFGCSGFCRDECMAISMVAASQHSACPAMRACAFALLGSSNIDGVVETATNFGNVLRDSGHLLSDQSIFGAGLLSGLDAPIENHEKH
jgi:hypothetical protein